MTGVLEPLEDTDPNEVGPKSLAELGRVEPSDVTAILSAVASGYAVTGGRAPWDARQQLTVRFLDRREVVHEIQVRCRISANPYVVALRYTIPRGHLIKANVMTNIGGGAPSTGGHPDFMQTFGNWGQAAYDIVFEGNYCADSASQFCQLEQKGVVDIRDWTFRGNVFVRVFGAANCDLPGVFWRRD